MIPPITDEERAHAKERLRGERVGIVLLSGGEASRLNARIPKGLLTLATQKRKTLFSLFFEKCALIERTYGCRLLPALLLSPNNEKQIKAYLKKKSREKACFFLTQKSSPFIYNEATFLSGPNQIAQAANGNGGLFEAHGLNTYLEALTTHGVRKIIVLPIDNPLLDPLPLSLYARSCTTAADITAAAFKKELSDTTVGVFTGPSNATRIIDYWHVPEKAWGNYIYANIGQYCFTLPFFKQLVADNPLPIHTIEKTTQLWCEDTKQCTEVSALKYEKFITDTLQYAAKTALVLFSKERRFAPIKTPDDIPIVEKKLRQASTHQDAIRQH